MSVRLTILLFCAALLAGCSGLAGEPRIVATLPPATAAPTPAPYPSTHPDIALGARVFAENCTDCHGAGGRGDGELVQSGQVMQAADFTNPASAAEQTPADYYAIITDGKLESLMPPWRDALTDAERWAAALYTYTLSNSQQQIARGEPLCAGCDAEIVAQAVSLTGSELDARLAQLPALAQASADDRAAAAAYVRSRSVTNPDAIGTTLQPEATAEPSASATAEAAATEVVLPTSVTVTGAVTNGTASSSVPPDLALTLHIFDASFSQQQVQGSVAPDGSFSFPDVPFAADYTYALTTTYRDVIFATDLLMGAPLTADAADGTLSLPLTIYELTEDPAVIEISGTVSQVSVTGEGLQVVQVFEINNTGDRAFTSSQRASNGAPISLLITLPPGALVLGFPENQNRFTYDAETFTVLDTLPALPGSGNIVQIIYLIPYTSGGAIIEQPLNYALNGAVRLLVSPLDVRITSDQLTARGIETLGTSQYQGYGADLSLSAGDVIRYEIAGAGSDPTAPPTVSSTNLLPVVLGVLLLAALLGGGLVFLGARSRTGAGDQQVIDILVRQIAELDAEHDAGNIDDDNYERQRAALKARLTSVMERKP